MRIITYIILSCFIAACSQSRSGGELEQALKLSGENRNALEAVLGHYKHDSLKYRASCFLIKNMPYHYSQEDYYLSPEGEKYRPEICKFKNKEELGMHCDSLTRCRYLEKHDMIYDVLSVDSSFLIKNIDLAFMAWEKPWARDVPFDVFCTYILPYRVQTEKISSLREEMMKRFLPLLDSAGVKTPLEACVALNEHLKSVVRYQDTGLPFYPTIEETYQSGISRCDGICNLGTYIMRAVGIPVAVDFTIWPKMDLGHSWCAVWNDGRFYSFGPGEDQPEVHARMFSQKRHRRPAKVYRYQFNPLHYGKISSTGGYQTFLNTPLWRDVTHEYLDKTTEFEVPILDKEKNNLHDKAYLCVHNYYEWKPLAVGSYLENGMCSFKNVVGDNIFMVADVTDNGALRYLTAPFYVSSNGEVHLFIPRSDQKFSYTFDKKKRSRNYTLHYWDVDRESFVSIPCKSSTDSTQTYEQIPENALYWLTLPERIVNQRVFFIEQDTIRRY